MTRARSGETVFKFGQKYSGPSQTPGESTLTNLYLNDEEYERLRQLGGREINKRRYQLEHGALVYAIDVFEGALEGLILSEIESETQPDFERLEKPSFASREVTGEQFFTGGYLAGLTKEEFLAATAKWASE
jgi:CYTH domain-containing protein